MTQTENYGFLLPADDDFYDVEGQQNENWNIVDKELYDHNSNKSNPHNTTAEQVGALPYYDRNLEAYNMTDLLTSGKHFEVVTIADNGTKGTPYSEGLSGVTIYTIISFATSKNNGMQIAIPSGRDNPVLFMRTFSGGMVGAWQTGFLPLEGGTLSGALSINHANGVYVLRTLNDIVCKMQAYIPNVNLGGGVGAGSLQLFKDDVVVAGLLFDQTEVRLYSAEASRNYKIFGQHNKPTGSYTGDGNSASRTISIGGIGNVAVIISAQGIAITSPYGAICKASAGTTVYGLSYSVCKINSQILTLATADNCLNMSGVTYTYYML